MLGRWRCWPSTLLSSRRSSAQWASDENYSHGFLVVPFALLFAWRSRRGLAIAAAAARARPRASSPLSMVVFLAGQFAAELFLMRVSLLGVIAGQHPLLWGPAFISAGWRFRWCCSCWRFRCLRSSSTRSPFRLQLLASRAGEAVVSGGRHPGPARRERPDPAGHQARGGAGLQRDPLAGRAAHARR